MGILACYSYLLYLVECTERCCISSLIWLCVSRAFSFTHWISSMYFSRLAPVEIYPLFMNLELWSHRMQYQPLGLISVAQQPQCIDSFDLRSYTSRFSPAQPQIVAMLISSKAILILASIFLLKLDCLPPFHLTRSYSN